jgi:hypothetical protein
MEIGGLVMYLDWIGKVLDLKRASLFNYHFFQVYFLNYRFLQCQF